MGNIWFIVMGCLSVLSFVELGIIIYLQKNRYCKVVKTTNISTEEVEEFVNESLFNQMLIDGANGKFDDGFITHYGSRVYVTFPCTKEVRDKCIAWPDRCEECGGDGEKCQGVIDLNKLCGIPPEERSPNLLSEELIKQLASEIVKFTKEIEQENKKR